MPPADPPIEAPRTVDVVVVGAASRDLAADDPRGWRLGGAVAYGSLTMARLGLRVAALVGADPDAARTEELDRLAGAGVEVVVVPLANGPVFDNIEELGGRRQYAHAAADPMPVAALPDSWRTAPAWLFAPVAGELEATWADVPLSEAIVAVGWQGLLRSVRPGEVVRPIAPSGSPLLDRADLVGVSLGDLLDGTPVADLCRRLRPGATLLVTGGADGGIAAEVGPDGPRRLHRYPAVRSDRVVDPTGAGDVFLAAVLAARVRPQLVGGRIAQRFDLLLGAAVSSLVVESPGLAGVATRDEVRRRLVEAAARRVAG